ncbi:MAG: hypothetical protein FWE74_07535 [Oscillospiraceae bacterium]|nr:hypothetical protein [Oscillospiraceae bacterium]
MLKKGLNENMKIKVFTAATTHDLEKDVNRFIAQRDIDVVKMDFSTAVTASVHMAYSVMVTYEAHGLVIENEEAL